MLARMPRPRRPRPVLFSGPTPELEQSDAAPTTAPEAEAETEVFYTFRLKPRHRPQGGNARGHGAGGRRGAPGRSEDGGDGKKFAGKKGGAKGKGGKRPPRNEGNGGQKPGHKPEPRGPDPDSPFAILQQLKGK